MKQRLTVLSSCVNFVTPDPVEEPSDRNIPLFFLLFSSSPTDLFSLLLIQFQLNIENYSFSMLPVDRSVSCFVENILYLLLSWQTELNKASISWTPTSCLVTYNTRVMTVDRYMAGFPDIFLSFLVFWSDGTWLYYALLYNQTSTLHRYVISTVCM